MQCNCLFVPQTMTLNCSHAFCSLCLDQWMKVKKECPVCRSPITSYVRARAVDSYIDKMCEHLSEAMREERKKLVEERKGKAIRSNFFCFISVECSLYHRKLL